MRADPLGIAGEPRCWSTCSAATWFIANYPQHRVQMQGPRHQHRQRAVRDAGDRVGRADQAEGQSQKTERRRSESLARRLQPRTTEALACRSAGQVPLHRQPPRDRHELAAPAESIGAEACLEDPPHRRYERRAARHEHAVDVRGHDVRRLERPVRALGDGRQRPRDPGLEVGARDRPLEPERRVGEGQPRGILA